MSTERVYVVMQQAPGVNQANLDPGKIYHSLQAAQAKADELNRGKENGPYYVKVYDPVILEMIFGSITIH